LAAIGADRDRGLSTRFQAQSPLTDISGVPPVTIPLRETASRSRPKNLDMHEKLMAARDAVRQGQKKELNARVVILEGDPTLKL
jgi:hypothetical protein